MNSPRLLVVDDEADIREILRFDLEADGYAVDTAASAEEALALLQTDTTYSLLLLDIMLPGMSGLELASTLRAAQRDLPVIFLTALGGHDDQLQGFAAGADDYIAKPFSCDTVLARIRAVLRRTSPSLSSASPAPSASEGGELLPGLLPPETLTRREYLILRLLASQPGHYFSRADILAAVWPDNTLVLPRSVDVHIARLRKKLGPDGSRLVAKTGFGYGLV